TPSFAQISSANAGWALPLKMAIGLNLRLLATMRRLARCLWQTGRCRTTRHAGATGQLSPGRLGQGWPDGRGEAMAPWFDTWDPIPKNASALRHARPRPH